MASNQYQHWDLEDPASQEGSEEEILGKFREVRDRLFLKLRERRQD